MARVVQRSSNPPYLVIIFLLLFLVSTTLAVMWNMKKGELAKENTKIQDRSDSLASKQELASPAVQAMMKAYDTPPKGARPQTVVGQLQSVQNQLSLMITGRQDMSLPAIKAKDDAVRASLGNTDMQRGLLDELINIKQQLDDEAAKVTARDASLSDKDDAIRAKEEAMKNLETTLSAQIAALQEKARGIEAQLLEEQQNHETQRSSDKADHDTRIEGFNVRVAKLNDEIQTLQLTIQKQTAEIEQLRKDLQKQTDPGRDLTKKGAGIVMSAPYEGVCFVNIGSREGVKPGLTLAVYPSGAITDKSKKKGSLLVTRVRELISECKVTETVDGVRIDKDDTIYNVAFDTKRTYEFVVAGLFDLHKAGEATFAGKEEVEMLIRSYGGTIAGDVTIKTDFVVLGEQMPLPIEPGPDDPATVIAVYRQRKALYARREEIRRKAIGLGIEILNTNKFLDNIGLVPKKTRSYE